MVGGEAAGAKVDDFDFHAGVALDHYVLRLFVLCLFGGWWRFKFMCDCLLDVYIRTREEKRNVRTLMSQCMRPREWMKLPWGWSGLAVNRQGQGPQNKNRARHGHGMRTSSSPPPLQKPSLSLPERLEALPGDEAEARLGEVGGLSGLPEEFGILVEVVLEQLRHQDQVLLLMCVGCQVVKSSHMRLGSDWSNGVVGHLKCDQYNVNICVRTL